MRTPQPQTFKRVKQFCLLALGAVLTVLFAYAVATSAAIASPQSSGSMQDSASEQSSATVVQLLWQDAEGKPLPENEIPQNTVVVELRENGKIFEPRKFLTLRASDGWTASLSDFPGITQAKLTSNNRYEVSENKVPKGFEVIGDGLTIINRKQPPQVPEIELYVDKDVHSDIVEFDRVFRYDIVAFVPRDAAAIEIVNTLPQEMHFVSTPHDIEASAQGIEASKHKAISAASAEEPCAIEVEGEPIRAEASINGQQLSVRVANIGNIMGMQRLRERAVRISFEAQLNEDIVSLEQLSVRKISDNGCVESTYSKHEGVVNQASYSIEINNRGESKRDYQHVASNQVSVMPEDMHVSAYVMWSMPGEQGTMLTQEWPQDVSSLELKLVKATTMLDRAGNPLVDKTGCEKTTRSVVDTLSLTPQTSELAFEPQPKLRHTRYELVQTTGTGYTLLKDIESVQDATTVSHTLINKPEEAELELYVNNSESHDYSYFDESFEYELLAYVTQDATSLTIQDTLSQALRFVRTDEIRLFDMGEELNNHLSSVTKFGAAIRLDDVSVSNNELRVTLRDVRPYRGHWLKLVFEATIAESAYESVIACIDEKGRLGTAADAEGLWANVSQNVPLLSTQTHDGVPNQAHYIIQTETEMTHECLSNTVTVEPSVMTSTVEQLFEDGWPSDISEVQAELSYGDKTQQLTLSPDKPRVVSQSFARLSGTQAKVTLLSLRGYDNMVYGSETDGFTIKSVAKYHSVSISKTDPQGAEIVGAVLELSGGPDDIRERWRVDADSKAFMLKVGQYALTELVAPEGYQPTESSISFTVGDDGAVRLVRSADIQLPAHLEGRNRIIVTNEPKTPQVEVYVNADVHADIVDFDRGFTYDVVAYVPQNTNSLEIKDVLPESLQFVDDANAVAQSALLRTSNTHRAGSTLTSTGDTCAVSIKIDGQTLTCRLRDVAAARGKYLQFSVAAKIKDNARTLDALGELVNVRDNGQVLSQGRFASGNSAASHKGIPNRARCVYGLVGERGASYTQTLTSNAVTVLPEMSSIKVSARWLDADGRELAWPRGAKVSAKIQGKADATLQTFELSSSETARFELPRLKGLSYKVSAPTLTAAPSGAQARVSGNATDGYLISITVPKRTPFSSVSVPIVVSTELVGAGPGARGNQFEFSLMGSNVSAVATNDDAGLVDFGDYVFTDPGVYSFIISGIEGNDSSIAYDSSAHAALVIVSKDVLTHQLIAEVFYDGADSLTISHKRIPLPSAVVDLGSAVNLFTNTSEVLLSSLAGNFSFELIDGHGQIVGTATNASDGSIVFPPLVFDQEGNYFFSMRQRIGRDNSIAYDLSEHSFEIRVDRDVYNNQERLTAYVEGFEGKGFVNAYSGPQRLGVLLKNANGASFAGARFVLQDESGQAIKTWLASDDIEEFELSTGRYRLIERETPEGYQALSKPIDFTVEGNGEVVLETTELSDGAKVTVNGGRIEIDYAPNPTLRIVRTTTSGSTLAGSHMLLSGAGFSYSWISNGNPHELQLKAGHYTLSELEAPQGYGRMTSSVGFTLDNNAAVVLDPSAVIGARASANKNVLTIETAPSSNVAILRTDSEGAALAGSRLELKNAQGELVDAWTSDDAPHELNLAMGAYRIEELVAVDGYRRMTGSLTFRIREDGSLVVPGLNAQGALARISDRVILLEALPLSRVSIAGQTALLIGDIAIVPQEGQFSFNLRDASGRMLETTSNDKDGHFEFSVLNFDEPGTYPFFVEQCWTDKLGTNDAITYDTHQACVNVSVKRNESSELEASVYTAEDDLYFEPALDTHAVAQVSNEAVNLSFKTMLDARDATEAGAFALRLEGRSANAQGINFESLNDETGTVVFEAINFEKPGLYEFELFERQGTQPNVGYDTSRYRIYIRASRDESGSKPKPKLECWAKNSIGNDINLESISFANVDRTTEAAMDLSLPVAENAQVIAGSGLVDNAESQTVPQSYSASASQERARTHRALVPTADPSVSNIVVLFAFISGIAAVCAGVRLKIDLNDSHHKRVT